jgi:hypothetical protein
MVRVGDYDLRGLSLEQFFAIDPLPDTCIDAANRAARAFDSTFPGWPLYARIVRGETYYDRTLIAWVVMGARMLARSRQKNGHEYIKPSTRGLWIAAAAKDALDDVIGCPPPSARERAREFGIKHDTYLRIFRPIRAMMQMGLMEYASELQYQFRQVRREERKILAG